MEAGEFQLDGDLESINRLRQRQQATHKVGGALSGSTLELGRSREARLALRVRVQRRALTRFLPTRRRADHDPNILRGHRPTFLISNANEYVERDLRVSASRANSPKGHNIARIE